MALLSGHEQTSAAKETLLTPGGKVLCLGDIPSYLSGFILAESQSFLFSLRASYSLFTNLNSKNKKV